jgi:TPR repeat protein/S1-C subfamily serine protease
MKTKFIFLLSVTFLFLFSGSVYGDDLQDGEDAYKRKDYKEAVRLWKPFAEQGNADAQLKLGGMYFIGHGVSQDYIEAVKWFRLSAEQGYDLAQNLLGLMYKKGKGVPQDYKEAFKWYRLSAEQGYAEAQYNLGLMYDNGTGVPQDYKEAVRLYRLSAEQGDAWAQNNLGYMYSEGKGVPQDYKEAVKWYRLSAEQGKATAQSNLGGMYKDGQGVPKVYKEAVKWYRLAAEQGNAKGQTMLGRMYQVGQGVSQDYIEAVKWYRLAAEQGDAFGQYMLGVMYEEGQGVSQDYALAHMWFNLAASSGVELIIKHRDDFEKQMSPSQIVEAQELVRNWKPNNSIKIAKSPPPTITPQPSTPQPSTPQPSTEFQEELDRLRQENARLKEENKPKSPTERIRIAESTPPQPSTPQPPKSKQSAIATGTGFLFGSQDYIVTNYHVVKGTSEVTVKFLNGESINAEVIATDTQNDVAILKLTKSPNFQSREMKFGDSSRVRMGDEVFTIGYPRINIMGLQPKYTKGVISSVTGIKDNPTVFQTTVPIQPGNSGGPLFNEKGEVIGLTTSSLSLLAIQSMGAVPQNVNYAVKSSFVKNTISTVPEALLSNRGIVVVPNESSSRSDFIQAIKKNVVLIMGKVD